MIAALNLQLESLPQKHLHPQLVIPPYCYKGQRVDLEVFILDFRRKIRIRLEFVPRTSRSLSQMVESHARELEIQGSNPGPGPNISLQI